MGDKAEIITVDTPNVGEYGFFCYKSKPKSAGYQQKLNWLSQRFSEGMRIKILYENGGSVGFIEYTPGESAWRAVRASNYLVIHCLWVVGRGKEKGYGSRLLNECIEDARRMQKHGVAMVTSSGNWLANKKVLLKNGFEPVDQAPPSFDLLVRKLNDAPLPAFPKDWDERLSRYGSGLTIVRSDQCPYVDNAVRAALEAAGEIGVETQVIELKSSQEVQDSAPSAYGVFNVVYDGKLLSYHSRSKKELIGLLDNHTG